MYPLLFPLVNTSAIDFYKIERWTDSRLMTETGSSVGNVPAATTACIVSDITTEYWASKSRRGDSAAGQSY